MFWEHAPAWLPTLFFFYFSSYIALQYYNTTEINKAGFIALKQLHELPAVLEPEYNALNMYSHFPPQIFTKGNYLMTLLRFCCSAF